MGDSSILDEAPSPSAPPISAYPQFTEVPVPLGSGALRAYRGFIRPFSDDATARRVLKGIAANKPLSVCEGRLDFDDTDLPAHPMERYLTEMAQPCTVLVLEHVNPKHPTAYLLDPAQVPSLSMNPHTWKRSVIIEGKAVAELCVYSGNLFKYDPNSERLPQFLNQLATYLAKHIVFLRTRMLYRVRKDGTLQQVKKRRPGEPVSRGSILRGGNLQWQGFWVGQPAPFGAAEHLRTVDPDGECWCNSGLLYRECDMEREQEKVEAQSGGNK